MNSHGDIRECYFKNRVTSLMTKGNVVKSLNQPLPMAKKKEPMEAGVKKRKSSKVRKAQESKAETTLTIPKVTTNAPNMFALKEKRK